MLWEKSVARKPAPRRTGSFLPPSTGSLGEFLNDLTDHISVIIVVLGVDGLTVDKAGMVSTAEYVANNLSRHFERAFTTAHIRSSLVRALPWQPSKGPPDISCGPAHRSQRGREEPDPALRSPSRPLRGSIYDRAISVHEGSTGAQILRRLGLDSTRAESRS